MKRKIIQIDKELCIGCGLCVNACHEGAIGMVGGKAELLRDDYCDGLGACLPVCPTGAISFIEREAAAFDEKAVAAQAKKQESPPLACGCPGSAARTLQPNQAEGEERTQECRAVASRLRQWPVQIRLVPVVAPYFDGAELLLAADCAAYAYGNFHNEFMSGKVTIIGCPKLDDVDYSEKLAAVLASNNISSVTVVRMEVPCCGGLEQAARLALLKSGKHIPLSVVVLTTGGRVRAD